MTCLAQGDDAFWIVGNDQPYFRAEPAVSVGPIRIFRQQDSELERLRQEIDGLVDALRDSGQRLVIYGSGNEATKLVAVSPGLRQVTSGVVDTQPSRHGVLFQPTGHLISSPSTWHTLGASHLLYASQAHQEEMHRQHQIAGPDGTFGIRIYPNVKILPITDPKQAD